MNLNYEEILGILDAERIRSLQALN